MRLALITRDWPARQSSGEVSRALLRALIGFWENAGGGIRNNHYLFKRTSAVH